MTINHISLEQKKEKFKDIASNIVKIFYTYGKSYKCIKEDLKTKREFFIIIAIVIIPALGIIIENVPIVVYSLYGIYFASIWSIILYKTIATDQVVFKQTLMVFCGTVLIAVIVLLFFNQVIQNFSFFSFINSDIIALKFISMFLGVAIIEEFTKQIFVYQVVLSNRFITMTRTAIFYGMIAGIAFGIMEGVLYQIGLNKQLEVDLNYFYNIIRITSIPFFHAMWAGIGGYFVALSFVLIKYKYSLRIFAIFIPALFHALYNTFGLTIYGITIVVISFLLLLICLTKNQIIYQQILNKYE